MAHKAFHQIWNLVPLFRSPRKFTHEIHPAESFHRILERERARTDRTGTVFSLVVFRIDNGMDDRSSTFRILAGCIRNRVRVGDEVGWFDDEHLATFLPGTPMIGARKFADKILDAVNSDIPPPPCRVFTYPARSSGECDTADGEKPGISVEGDGGGDGGALKGRIESVLVPPVLPWKRMLDIVGALAGMILLSPLFLLLAVFIKVVSSGPVFYRQERVGYKGKTFTLWKFRTMKPDTDSTSHHRHVSHLIQGDDPMQKLDDKRDPRIIPFGNVLRYSCLDELPQLFNVLRGDMSLVGPRPCLPYEAKKYLLWQTRRFDTIPGMTGLWQVSGKNRTTFKEMIRLDISYVRRMSLWQDVKILLKTVPVIFFEIADKFDKRVSLSTSVAVPPKEHSK